MDTIYHIRSDHADRHLITEVLDRTMNVISWRFSGPELIVARLSGPHGERLERLIRDEGYEHYLVVEPQEEEL